MCVNTGTKLNIKLQGQNIILYRFKTYVIKQKSKSKECTYHLGYMNENKYIKSSFDDNII